MRDTFSNSYNLLSGNALLFIRQNTLKSYCFQIYNLIYGNYKFLSILLNTEHFCTILGYGKKRYYDFYRVVL
jgi:hypothetical protein